MDLWGLWRLRTVSDVKAIKAFKNLMIVRNVTLETRTWDFEDFRTVTLKSQYIFFFQSKKT